MKILRNALKCRECGDVIESVSTDEWVFCSCHRCGLRGGTEFVETTLIDYPKYDLITEREFENRDEKRRLRRNCRKSKRHQRKEQKRDMKKLIGGRHR